MLKLTVPIAATLYYGNAIFIFMSPFQIVDFLNLGNDFSIVFRHIFAIF